MPERLVILRSNYERAVERVTAPVSAQYRDELLKMKIEYTRPDPVGITISRDTMQAVDTNNLRLILRRDPSMPTGYRIHTGFPINE